MSDSFSHFFSKRYRCQNVWEGRAPPGGAAAPPGEEAHLQHAPQRPDLLSLPEERGGFGVGEERGGFRIVDFVGPELGAA